MGIEKTEIPRIFERFYRVNKARDRNSGGTGLGLAIVKHLMEAHKGKVTVQSELGKGTTFNIELLKKISASVIVNACLSEHLQNVNIGIKCLALQYLVIIS